MNMLTCFILSAIYFILSLINEDSEDTITGSKENPKNNHIYRQEIFK